MKDLDDRIRDVLGGLRQAPIPRVPRIQPAAPRPRRLPPALFAAAAMLLLLAASLYFMPSRSRAPEAAALADRISTLEARIARIEDEQLRSLMGRELALLRRELELSASKE
jgi:hypothetical protein